MNIINQKDHHSFSFLLNHDGLVCALTGEENSFAIALGTSWQDLWPKKPLKDNLSFTFDHDGHQWAATINQLIDKSANQASYLVTYRLLPGQVSSDNNNQLKPLQEKISFYETIINNSNDEIFITNGDGLIIYANPASEGNYGLPVSEMVGKGVLELEDRGIYFPAVTPIVLKEKRKITINQETATGKYLIVTGTPVFNEKGDIEIVICNSRDVTSLEDMKKSYHNIKSKIQKMAANETLPSNEDNSRLIYTYNSPLARLMGLVNKIAKTNSTILLQGDTGTGKDMLAKRIHDLSDRKDKDFLKVNCAALPQELIESELFGYKPGAFTGASSKGKIGLFTLADQGTIFLDEIAEIPMVLQPKLLQVIEEQKFTPIGSKAVENVNVRIIAATNRDINEMVKDRQFRDDLYYRLCVFSVYIPPLKDRVEDIPLLINHYLTFYNNKHNCSVNMSREAMKYLTAYDWPGNVRELKHLVERLTVTVSTSYIKPEHLPVQIVSSRQEQNSADLQTGNQDLKTQLEDLEKEIILNSYHRLRSSYEVARELGISQSSATRKILKYKKQA